MNLDDMLTLIRHRSDRRLIHLVQDAHAREQAREAEARDSRLRRL